MLSKFNDLSNLWDFVILMKHTVQWYLATSFSSWSLRTLPVRQPNMSLASSPICSHHLSTLRTGHGGLDIFPVPPALRSQWD
jgi:hypothetical protein